MSRTSERHPPRSRPRPEISFFRDVGTIHINGLTYNSVEISDTKFTKFDSDPSDDETDYTDCSDDELDPSQHADRYLDAVKMQRKMNRMKKEADARAKAMGEKDESLRTTEEERPEGQAGEQEKGEQERREQERREQEKREQEKREQEKREQEKREQEKREQEKREQEKREGQAPDPVDNVHIRLGNATLVQVRNRTRVLGRNCSNVSVSMFNTGRKAPSAAQPETNTQSNANIPRTRPPPRRSPRSRITTDTVLDICMITLVVSSVLAVYLLF